VIDVDGVIYNFVDAFMNRYVFHGGKIPEGWEWNDWDSMNRLPDQNVVDHIWERDDALMFDGEPYFGAIPALKWLNKRYDVVLASAVPFFHVNARAEWFKLHAPFIHRKNQIIITNDKSRVVGDLLIEDNLDNLKKWLKFNGSYTAFCVDRPWNKENPPYSYERVPSLQYIAELMGGVE
jgi:5'(3')-deoxyribonucleotidase